MKFTTSNSCFISYRAHTSDATTTRERKCSDSGVSIGDDAVSTKKTSKAVKKLSLSKNVDICTKYVAIDDEHERNKPTSPVRNKRKHNEDLEETPGPIMLQPQPLIVQAPQQPPAPLIQPGATVQQPVVHQMGVVTGHSSGLVPVLAHSGQVAQPIQLGGQGPKMFPEQWITAERYPAEMRRKRLKEKQEAVSSLEMKQNGLMDHCGRIMKRVRLSLGKLAELGITDYTPQIYDPESLLVKFEEEQVKAKKQKEQAAQDKAQAKETEAIPEATNAPAAQSEVEVEKALNPVDESPAVPEVPEQAQAESPKTPAEKRPAEDSAAAKQNVESPAKVAKAPQASSVKESRTPTQEQKTPASESQIPYIDMTMFHWQDGLDRFPVTRKDYASLNKDRLLNDSIINFYLRYVCSNKLKPEQRSRCHVFSSFFYQRLAAIRGGPNHPTGNDTKLTEAENRHSRVKSWTKNVDIFDKDFIFVPINEHNHWFLAIICFPGLNGPVSALGDSAPSVEEPVKQ
jgi:Ulp1 protease family, C-terminal catalytic domain